MTEGSRGSSQGSSFFLDPDPVKKKSWIRLVLTRLDPDPVNIRPDP